MPKPVALFQASFIVGEESIPFSTDLPDPKQNPSSSAAQGANGVRPIAPAAPPLIVTSVITHKVNSLAET